MRREGLQDVVQKPMRHGHGPRTRPSTRAPAALTLLHAEVFQGGGTADAGGTLLQSTVA